MPHDRRARHASGRRRIASSATISVGRLDDPLQQACAVLAVDVGLARAPCRDRLDVVRDRRDRISAACRLPSWSCGTSGGASAIASDALGLRRPAASTSSTAIRCLGSRSRHRVARRGGVGGARRPGGRGSQPGARGRSAASSTALSAVANQVFLHWAQRTERPAAPSAASCDLVGGRAGRTDDQHRALAKRDPAEP